MGQLEHLVLLTLKRLGDEAYGMTVRRELGGAVGRPVAAGSVYVVLGRLEKKGLVRSRRGLPTPARGGRAKRFFVLTHSGQSVLESFHLAYSALTAPAQDQRRMSTGGSPR